MSTPPTPTSTRRVAHPAGMGAGKAQDDREPPVLPTPMARPRPGDEDQGGAGGGWKQSGPGAGEAEPDHWDRGGDD